jgi:hypothetical protein
VHLAKAVPKAAHTLEYSRRNRACSCRNRGSRGATNKDFTGIGYLLTAISLRTFSRIHLHLNLYWIACFRRMPHFFDSPASYMLSHLHPPAFSVHVVQLSPHLHSLRTVKLVYGGWMTTLHQCSSWLLDQPILLASQDANRKIPRIKV